MAEPYPTLEPWKSPEPGHLSPQVIAEIRAALMQDPIPTPISQISGYAGSYISGRVHADGSVSAGTGFTVNKTGTGIYEIAYNQAYSIEPFVVATLIGDPVQSGGAVVYGLDSHDEAGFTLHWAIVGAPDADQAFMFLSYAVRR